MGFCEKKGHIAPSEIWTPDERRDNQEGLLRALAEEAKGLRKEQAEELRRGIQNLNERRDSYERVLRGLVQETDERRDSFEK